MRHASLGLDELKRLAICVILEISWCILSVSSMILSLSVSQCVPSPLSLLSSLSLAIIITIKLILLIENITRISLIINVSFFLLIMALSLLTVLLSLLLALALAFSDCSVRKLGLCDIYVKCVMRLSISHTFVFCLKNIFLIQNRDP